MKITQVLHKTDILKIKDIFYFSSSCKNNICTQVDSDFLKEFVEIPDKDDTSEFCTNIYSNSLFFFGRHSYRHCGKAIGDLCKRNKECGHCPRSNGPSNSISINAISINYLFSLLFNENKCLYLDDIENGKFKILNLCINLINQQ
ncbi:hypothetical protein U3516DRAFT_750767 [Neocallimastix sp. 'constans']